MQKLLGATGFVAAVAVLTPALAAGGMNIDITEKITTLVAQRQDPRSPPPQRTPPPKPKTTATPTPPPAAPPGTPATGPVTNPAVRDHRGKEATVPPGYK